MAGGRELKLAIAIGAKIDKSLGSAINAAQAQLSGIGKGVGRVAKAITVATAAAGVKLVKDSIEAYTTYESSLAKTAATAGVEKGTAAYKKLNDAAREAGASTVKTAKESADALGYMALAGWSVDDSTKALMPILKLSAATGTELATTSDLVTDSMANLGLGINDLNRYLNVATAANNKSNQSAMELMEAYLGVGGVLNNLNSPIEESAAVLGVLANRGTKGSEAGTALNAILVNMQKKSGDSAKAMAQLGVSMYDAKGNARSIIDVFQDISDKTSGMTEQQRNLMYQMIGGKSHLDSFAKIMQGFTTTTADGSKEVYSLITSFQNCNGSLDKFYDTYTNTVEGSKEALSSAFEGMKIDIGEKLAPTVTSFYKGITNNMPNIEKVIMNVAEKAIPAVSKALDFLAKYGDKVVSIAVEISKAFIGYKLGTGMLNGINTVVSLFNNLKKLSAAAGITNTLKGVLGALTGISTATGSVSGAVLGVAASFGAAVAPIAAFAAIVAVANAMYTKSQNWASGMNKQAEAIDKSAQSLIKYNDIATEVAQLRHTIANPDSSGEAVENAKVRLQEISDMLEKEYNLKIDCDTTQLEKAIELTQAASRSDLVNSASEYIDKASKNSKDYKNAKNGMTQLENNVTNSADRRIELLSLYERAKSAESRGKAGTISEEQYTAEMNGIRAKADEMGYSMTFQKKASSVNTTSGELIGNLKYLSDNAQFFVENARTELKTAQQQVQEYEESTVKAGNALNEVLASDTKLGNLANIDSDIAQIQALGQSMVDAGANTDILSTQFAAAKAGYTDFSAAIANGKAGEMAQSFIEFKTQIGDTAESAVQGAALIANGFQNVQAATAAGSAGIQGVLNTLAQFGNQQGLFDGLDTAGIAAKLTEMAQAMNLIPDNKEIHITADGAVEVADKIQSAADGINGLPINATVDATVTAGNIDTSGVQSGINTATAGNSQTAPPANVTQDVVVNAGNVDISGVQNSLFGKFSGGLGSTASVNVAINATGNAASTAQTASNAINSMPQSKNIAINASGNATSAAQTASNAINGMPQFKNIAINASGNATNAAQTATNAINRIPTSHNTAINANDAVTVKAGAATNAINRIPTSHNTAINASGNALSTVQSISSGIRNLPSSKTITVNIKQNGSLPHTATGSSDWRGGYTYLNDQSNVRDPREVIESPNGTKYWYEGRNVIAFVPKHSVIYPASESKAIINGSHRNGLERVPFDGYVAELHENEQVLTSDEAEDYRRGGVLSRAIDRLRYTQSKSRDTDETVTDGSVSVVYSPNIVIEGDADENVVNSALRSSYEQFTAYMERYERDRRRKSFAA